MFNWEAVVLLRSKLTLFSISSDTSCCQEGMFEPKVSSSLVQFLAFSAQPCPWLTLLSNAFAGFEPTLDEGLFLTNAADSSAYGVFLERALAQPYDQTSVMFRRLEGIMIII